MRKNLSKSKSIQLCADLANIKVYMDFDFFKLDKFIRIFTWTFDNYHEVMQILIWSQDGH